VSWPLVAIGEFCDLKNGYAFKSDDYIDKSNTLNCRMSNIRPGGYFDLKYSPKYLPDEYVEKYSDFLLKDGDVVIAMTDLASSPKILGVPTVVKTNGKNVLLNQRVGKLTIENKSVIHLPYLQLALNYPKVREVYKRFAGGGLQINAGKADILSVKIPLPPLNEQKRIAAILDKADSLRRKRQQAIQLADQFLRSVFLDLFGDPLNPNVSTVTLGELAELIMGQSPSGSSYNESGNGSPLINGPVEFGKYSPTERQWTTSPSKYAKAGDILFCVRGATAGKLNIADKEYCIGRGVAAIRPKNIKTAKFIFKVLDLSYDFFQKAGVGSTFINISKEQLLEFRLPNSSEIEMDEFFTISEYVESIKGNGEQFLESSNNEFNSLSQKAFAGEL